MLFSDLFPPAKSRPAGVLRPRLAGWLRLGGGAVPAAVPVSGDDVLEGSQAAHHAVVAAEATEPRGDAVAANDCTADGTANSSSDKNAASATRPPH